MTKRLLAIFVASMTLFACSAEDDENPNPPSGETSSGLSTSFQSICATCHGPEGKGQAQYPAIPGSKDEAAFIAIVRSGKGDMPANDTSRISETDLKADYLWLTTKRK
jgi:mono/diheme cytochrome c family protein